MENFEFILVANSPGELSSLVKPIVERIKLLPIKTSLFLTPCQFSSGREKDFIKSLNIDNVVPAEEYRKWILGIPLKRELKFKDKGAVLYLGGDLMHAVLIAKKLGYKVYAYLHGQKAGWKNVFSKFFVQDHKAEKDLRKSGIGPEKIKIAGDLMLNSIKIPTKDEVVNKWQLNKEKPIIAMLPGSRDWEINYMLPFYETVAAELKKIITDLQIMLIISPFSSLKEVESMVSDGVFDVMSGIDSVAAADLAITIPGTNTAQIAVMGVATLMLFPLDKIDDIPMEGLFHYLTKIPFFGRILKRIAVEIIDRKTPFFALPNIKAKRMIVPEMRGYITPEQVVEKVMQMMKHPHELKKSAEELKSVMGESNAAEIIVGEILDETFSKAG